jgi:hypothetical protein
METGLPNYDLWAQAVRGMGGRTTTFPFTQTVFGVSHVYGVPAAAFALTEGSDLTARGILPARGPDGASADHRTWYYVAPPEVIREAPQLVDATRNEAARAGALVLEGWLIGWRRALGEIPKTFAGFIPWWLWAAGAVVVANSLGLLKFPQRTAR